MPVRRQYEGKFISIILEHCLHGVMSICPILALLLKVLLFGKVSFGEGVQYHLQLQHLCTLKGRSAYLPAEPQRRHT